MLCKNYEKIVKIGFVPLFHKQCKTLFRDHMVRLKIISLYIYKDIRLKTATNPINTVDFQNKNKHSNA